MRLWIDRLSVFCLLLAASRPLAAQGRPIQVEGAKNLAFGILLAGTPLSVARTDPVGAGQINVAAQPNAQIILQLSPPSVMNGPAGATLPISFSANDAGYSPIGVITSQTAFDPRSSAVVLTNTRNGRGTVYVGGTAQPSASQRPGNYTGVITLTVAYP